MELERRAKDPSRLMNARGNSLLVEEKERNKVNKALPRIEQELQELINNWESENGSQFKVGGVSQLTLFILKICYKFFFRPVSKHLLNSRKKTMQDNLKLKNRLERGLRRRLCFRRQDLELNLQPLPS